MNDIRHLTLVLLWVVVVSQSLFVFRYGFRWGWPLRFGLWRDDFVGRALFFKSSAVLAKAVVELLLWTTIPHLIDHIDTWLLVAVVFSDIGLALGCTWQYTALERQKREDRREGTELGRDVDASAE